MMITLSIISHERSIHNDFIRIAFNQGKFSSAFHFMEKTMTILSSTCPLLRAPEATPMPKWRDYLIWNIQVLMVGWLILPGAMTHSGLLWITLTISYMNIPIQLLKLMT
jgi:hypothetical protein